MGGWPSRPWLPAPPVCRVQTSLESEAGNREAALSAGTELPVMTSGVDPVAAELKGLFLFSFSLADGNRVWFVISGFCL